MIRIGLLVLFLTGCQGYDCAATMTGVPPSDGTFECMALSGHLKAMNKDNIGLKLTRPDQLLVQTDGVFSHDVASGTDSFSFKFVLADGSAEFDAVSGPQQETRGAASYQITGDDPSTSMMSTLSTVIRPHGTADVALVDAQGAPAGSVHYAF